MYMCDKGDKKMNIVIDKKNNETIEVDSQVRKSKIPHLRAKNGRIEIDKNDPVQVNWFKNFRK